MELQSTTDALHEKTEAFEDLQAGHNLLESEKAGLAKELKERTEEREKALKETAKCMDERDELRSSVDDAEYGRMDAQRKLAAAERCVCSSPSLRSHRSVAHLTLAFFLCLSPAAQVVQEARRETEECRGPRIVRSHSCSLKSDLSLTNLPWTFILRRELENDLKVKTELLASRAEEVDVLEQELIVERAEIPTLKEERNGLLKWVPFFLFSPQSQR